MVGKTNLIFISKGDASSVQLIQKSYATDATGEIYRIEVMNNRFFAFTGSKTGKKNVLMGTGAENLSFARKDNELLEATHIIYIEGKYYVVKSGDACTDIYETVDFKEYKQVIISGIEEKWFGIFLNSYGEIVLVSYTENGTVRLKIYLCKSLNDIVNAQIVECTLSNMSVTDAYNTCLINNRIFSPDGKQISLNGNCVNPNSGWSRWNYAGGYFFQMPKDDYNNYPFYRSRDLTTITQYPYYLKELNIYGNVNVCVIPISGKYCLLYKHKDRRNYVNIADDILSVGHQDNLTIERADELDIKSVVENDGKTYVGTTNGVIYEFQLDYEGTIQRPDVAIIKTLAAKQALAQSLQYTDECIAKLKDYIDGKIEKEPSAVENNSTKVES